MSDNDIYNGALFIVGERAILDVEGSTSKPAILLKRLYPILRDEVLAEHPWRFAAKRAALAPSGTSPEWGFTYLFTYPSDWIRLIKVQDSASHKTAEGGILANDNPLYIEYVYRCKIAAMYSPEFCGLLKLRIAKEICIPLTNDKELLDRISSDYEKSRRKATFVSASQTSDDEEQEESEGPWLDVRV